MKKLNVLAKFFDVSEDIFERLLKDRPDLKDKVSEWVEAVKAPHYQLEHWQHNFLIGMPLGI